MFQSGRKIRNYVLTIIQWHLSSKKFNFVPAIIKFAAPNHRGVLKEDNSQPKRSVGRVVRQGSAKARTAVQIRHRPLYLAKSPEFRGFFILGYPIRTEIHDFGLILWA